MVTQPRAVEEKAAASTAEAAVGCRQQQQQQLGRAAAAAAQSAAAAGSVTALGLGLCLQERVYCEGTHRRHGHAALRGA